MLRIELDDLMQYDAQLVTRAEENAQRYVKLFEKAADELLKDMDATVDVSSSVR